jgi:hypothetical protein
VTFAAPSLALMLVALLGFLVLERARRRGALAPRRCDALLAVLVGAAFLAHLGLLRGGGGGGRGGGPPAAAHTAPKFLDSFPPPGGDPRAGEWGANDINGLRPIFTLGPGSKHRDGRVAELRA